MAETLARIPSPEIPKFTKNLVGLQTRLLLTGDALNPNKTDLTPVNPEIITDIKIREYGLFDKASTVNRHEFWQENTAGVTYDAQYHSWSQDFVRLIRSEKNQPIVSAIKKISTVSGIQFGEFDAIQAQAFYNRYLGGKSDVKVFVTDVLEAYRHDGKIDFDAVEKDLGSWQWLAHTFGAQASEMVSQLIDAESKLQVDDQKLALIKTANESEKVGDREVLRINQLDDKEKEILTFIWGKSHTDLSTAKNKSRPTDSMHDETGWQFRYERLGDPRVFPEEDTEAEKRLFHPREIALNLIQFNPKYKDANPVTLAQEIEGERTVMRKWLDEHGLDHETLQSLVVDSLASFDKFVTDKYGIKVPDIKHLTIFPMSGKTSERYNHQGQAFAMVHANYPVVFLDMNRIIQYAKKMSFEEMGDITKEAVTQNIKRLLVEINPHEYTHLTADLAYWYTNYPDKMGKVENPFSGKLGLNVIKPFIDDEGTLRGISRGSGLMEAVTVELTNQWAKSFNSRLDIPAYEAERRVLHTLINRLAQEDGLTGDDIFKKFTEGYFTPQGFRKLVEFMDGHTVKASKRPRLTSTVYALMEYELVMAITHQIDPNYALTINFINNQLSTEQKQNISQLLANLDKMPHIQLPYSARQSLGALVGLNIPDRVKTTDTAPPLKKEDALATNEIHLPKKEFPVEKTRLVGTGIDKLRLVFSQSVIKKANEDLKTRSWQYGTFKEQGGFFVGHRYQTSSGEVWTEVTDYYPATKTANESAGQIRFTSSTFADINNIIDKLNVKDPALFQVGWAHTHPHGWAGMMTPNQDGVVNAFYSAPGQFAYVYAAGENKNIGTDISTTLTDINSFFSKGGTDTQVGTTDFYKHKGIYIHKEPTEKFTETTADFNAQFRERVKETGSKTNGSYQDPVTKISIKADSPDKIATAPLALDAFHQWADTVDLPLAIWETGTGENKRVKLMLKGPELDPATNKYRILLYDPRKTEEKQETYEYLDIKVPFNKYYDERRKRGFYFDQATQKYQSSRFAFSAKPSYTVQELNNLLYWEWFNSGIQKDVSLPKFNQCATKAMQNLQYDLSLSDADKLDPAVINTLSLPLQGKPEDAALMCFYAAAVRAAVKPGFDKFKTEGIVKFKEDFFGITLPAKLV